MLDKRCKHKYREINKFCLYIKYQRSGIFYVKFQDGKCVSTHTGTIDEAYNFALSYLNQLPLPVQQARTERTNRTCIHDTLNAYYSKPDTEFIQYDINHGSKYSEYLLTSSHSKCQVISKYLSDITYWDELTRSRLIKLQDQLREAGLSAKTCNNYFAAFHKVTKQMYDREFITSDPFIGLKPCSGEKEARLCFPISKLTSVFKTLKSKYDLLAYCAIVTGCRKAELQGIEPSDLWESNGMHYIHIRGTKTENAVRDVPISEYSRNALLALMKEHITERDFKKCVEYIGRKIGCFDMIKTDHIVFHSFRKCFCSILNQANINTSLIEMIIGHSTKNQASNDVRRIYFVEDRIDMTKIHPIVIAAFNFLYQ